ncbi:MAG: matrixin family metalloprotease [Heliobacteriaceae bacterium]|jgi:predicted Zn-dependent protease|nr:matrixin family metalloprotease [Heliobacteriaceae bacterium]
MQKYFLILTAFILMITNVCYAGSAYTDTYISFPVKVYIPPHPKAFIVKDAFAEWIQKTNGRVKVEYIPEQRRKAASLIFEFVNTIDSSDDTNHTLGTTQRTYNGRILAYSVIKIGLLDRQSGKPVSDSSLHYIILHEIGHAFGLNHSNDVESIMYYQYNPIIRQTLTKEDIADFVRMQRGY